MNTLYYGDNLKILRDHIKDESVAGSPPARGGVAAGRGGGSLDPPFNSNRNLFFNDFNSDLCGFLLVTIKALAPFF